MIVVPPPAETLGPPPRAEAPGLSALFDDIPRSDPSIPIPRAAPASASTRPAAGFDIDIGVDVGAELGADVGIADPVGGAGAAPGQDDPTIDLPHAFGAPPPPDDEQPLGAALVAAFEHNRTAPVEVGQLVDVAPAGAFSLDTEQSTMSMPSPIVVRLRDLQQRLVAEGRATDAQVIAQALALLESGGA
jgi:hypothetical protein